MEPRTKRTARNRWILPSLICAAGALGTAAPRSVWASYPSTQTDAAGDWTTAVRISAVNPAGTIVSNGTANLFAMQTTPAGLIDLSFVTADHIFDHAAPAAPGGYTSWNFNGFGLGNVAGGINFAAGMPGVVSANVALGAQIQQQIVGVGPIGAFGDVAEVNVQINPALLPAATKAAELAAIDAMIPIGLAAAPATPFVFQEHGFGTTAVPITPAETAAYVTQYTNNYIAFLQTPGGGGLTLAQAQAAAALPANVAAINTLANNILYVQHPNAGVLPAAEQYGTERYFTQTASSVVNNFSSAGANTPYYSYTALQWTLPTPAAATLSNPDAGGNFGDSGAGIFSLDSHNIVGVLTSGTSSNIPNPAGGFLNGFGVGSVGDALDFNQSMVNELNQLSYSFFAPEPSSGMLLAMGAAVAGICAWRRRTRGMGGRA